MKEAFLHKKLDERMAQNALRQLRLPDGKTDFCSNDYLGLATYSGRTATPPSPSRSLRHGSGGSRLLAGNYALIEETEIQVAAFHEAETGLIFNSGYDANMGLLSSVPQRGDTILYDYLSHASIRDGIRLSFAGSFAFRHNDMEDLEKKLQLATSGTTFVVTESVFSMDGDQAPLEAIVRLCTSYGAQLIVDEAHATGVIGKKGEGLVQALGLQEKCFARIHTFGKAVGAHGAVIAGSATLRNYLINFSRAFIYTTALPETSLQAIRNAYVLFPNMEKERAHLATLITQFQQSSLSFEKLSGTTPIQGVVVPGNEAVRALASRLQTAGLDVRPILYPTVPRDRERLRIVLHSFNTEVELNQLISLLT